MATDFDRMTHETIFDVVKAGAPTAVSGAASQLAGLNTTVTGHLDTLDRLSASMADAWPDENGQNFRSTLSHTITYLRELQATHVVAASSSITQVMSASHEKLSHTQAAIPTPPAVPVADQERTLTKQLAANDDAMTAGLAAESQRIAAGKADDAKAVLLAKSLANTYLSEMAKLTAPPAAPKGPGDNGGGAPTTPGGGANGSSSNHTMAGYTATPGSGSFLTGPVGGSTAGTGDYGNGDGHASASVPVPGGAGGLDGSYGGLTAGDTGTGGTGTDGGSVGGNHGAPLDPNGYGPLYDAHGNLIGGGGYDPSAPGFDGGAPAVGGVLGVGGMNGGVGGMNDGPGDSGGSGAGWGAGALGALGGGLIAAGVIAARKEAAQRASRQAALLLSEELGANGAGGAGRSLTASQIAAMNAQRNGILAAGEQAGLTNGERAMLSARQPGLLRANAALMAQEEAQLAANQRLVPGQLGATPAAAASAGARTGMPFAGGGVVGGAERVTWLVEDRDLFSADPGVRAIIED